MTKLGALSAQMSESGQKRSAESDRYPSRSARQCACCRSRPCDLCPLCLVDLKIWIRGDRWIQQIEDDGAHDLTNRSLQRCVVCSW